MQHGDDIFSRDWCIEEFRYIDFGDEPLER